jgi:adenosylcobinamide-GDP ribazoletransferase
MRMLLTMTPRIMRDLRDAVHFLTRLPVPGAVSHRNLRDALGAFPLAGAVLGAVLAVLDVLLGFLHIPGALRAAFVVACWCWLTDAMHLEGVMRTADLLAAPYQHQEDERTVRAAGAAGTVAAAAVLLAKVVLLTTLHGPARLEALLLAPMLGRWCLALAAALYPSSSLDGYGVRGVSKLRLIEAAVIAITLTPLAGANGMIGWLLCSALVWRLGRFLAPRLVDHTGDLYGMIVECAEVTALVVCALGVTGFWSPIIIVP